MLATRDSPSKGESSAFCRVADPWFEAPGGSPV
jgi:hypothetical protein